MTESAIFTGGAEQLVAAVFGALCLLYVVPDELGNGWTRWRVAGFFLLWQAFTPLRPWYLDLPLLVACMICMEVAYSKARRRRHPSSGDNGES